MILKPALGIVLFFAISPVSLFAQYAFELSPLSGIMVSHSIGTANLNLRKSMGIQSTVIWKLPPNNATIPAHPPARYRYLGFSVLGMDMGDGFLNGTTLHRENTSRMGMGAGAMMVAGSNIPLKKSSGKNNLRFQSGFGPLLVTKYYNSITNPNNLAISSVFNFGTQLKAQFLRKINASSTLSAGVELFHVSNSNFQKPNYGLNYLQYSMGWSHTFHESGEKTAADSGHLRNRMYYIGKVSAQYASRFQGSVRMAYRKFRNDYPVYYPVLILEGNYGFSNKKVNTDLIPIEKQPLPKGEWRIGWNLFHEIAATAKSENGTWLSLAPRWELGLFGRRIFRFGFIDVFIDLGTYVIPPQSDRIKLLFKNRWLYNSFGTQYRLNKNVFLMTRIKAHFHVADYLETGLVFRL